jgi:hypothetical protein
MPRASARQHIVSVATPNAISRQPRSPVNDMTWVALVVAMLGIRAPWGPATTEQRFLRSCFSLSCYCASGLCAWPSVSGASNSGCRWRSWKGSDTDVDSRKQQQTLAHHPYPIVRVACRYCGRRGRYHLHRLIETHGREMRMDKCEQGARNSRRPQPIGPLTQDQSGDTNAATTQCYKFHADRAPQRCLQCPDGEMCCIMNQVQTVLGQSRAGKVRLLSVSIFWSDALHLRHLGTRRRRPFRAGGDGPVRHRRGDREPRARRRTPEDHREDQPALADARGSPARLAGGAARHGHRLASASSRSTARPPTCW